ncbi:Iron-sulfur flavoprotein [uncultured archaeon]|nr:Iron-sulfur flavoprotein [uncultured archaeon]
MTTKSNSELMKELEIDAETLKRFKTIQNETILEAKKLGKSKNKKIKIIGISGSARDELDMAQQSSNSEELLKKCLKVCEAMGAETELIPLRKYKILPCKACYSSCNTQCHFYCSCYPKGEKTGDDMTNILYDKVLEADGIIFATPVNNFAMSSLMKLFLDRCISLDGSLSPADKKSPKNLKLNIKHMKFVEKTADNNVPGSGMLKRFTGKTAGVIVTGHEEGASMVISSLFMTLNHFGMVFPPFSNVYAMASVCNSTFVDKGIVENSCHVDWVEDLGKNVFNMCKLMKNEDKNTWKYEYSEN